MKKTIAQPQTTVSVLIALDFRLRDRDDNEYHQIPDGDKWADIVSRIYTVYPPEEYWTNPQQLEILAEATAKTEFLNEVMGWMDTCPDLKGDTEGTNWGIDSFITNVKVITSIVAKGEVKKAVKAESTTAPVPTVQEHPLYSPILDEPIESLNLTTRATNVLQNHNLRYIGDVVQKTETQLFFLDGMGQSSIKAIKEALKEKDLALALFIPNWKSPK